MVTIPLQEMPARCFVYVSSAASCSTPRRGSSRPRSTRDSGCRAWRAGDRKSVVKTAIPGSQLASLALASFVLATPLTAAADAGEHVGLLRTALRAPAEFYRSRQQINGGAMILGPIQASRQHLEVARESLKLQEYGEALAATRAASMDCVVFNFGEDNRAGRQDLSTASSAEQEYKLGDPCKLRLVVKNATTLTRDPELIAGVKYQLQTVIRQFNLLDDMLERAQQGDGKAVEGVSQLLDDALDLNTKFEDGIKKCLGL